MRILIAWDGAPEAELLRLYLATADHLVAVVRGAAEALAEVGAGAYDVLLLSLTFPSSAEEGFALFRQVQQVQPGLAVVLACPEAEMPRLPRFLTHGLRSYLIRDQAGNFVFLALSSLEAAVAALRAEESRKLAERLRQELEGVRRLQESIIPRGLPVPPGYRVAARYEPSEVSVVGDRPVVLAGGDYYDVFQPDDRTLVVLLGDASGHGLKACMSILTMHTLIRMMPGDRYRDTAAFVGEINQRLCDSSIIQNDGGFITLFYAAIDTVTHTLRWTSAGHPLPVLQRLDTGVAAPIGSEADGDLPLGICPGLGYTEAELLLPPGSRLLLYTDGLSEAFPMEGDSTRAFGVRGIRDVLDACRDGDLEEALGQLLAASHACTGGSGRHDDTSVVLVERCAGEAVAAGTGAVNRGGAALDEPEFSPRVRQAVVN
jgi:sigma-B regulation protein RsbU (phosphoserine phosphatase)